MTERPAVNAEPDAGPDAEFGAESDTASDAGAVPGAATAATVPASAAAAVAPGLGLPIGLIAVLVAGAGLAFAADASALTLLVATAVVQAGLGLAWVVGTSMPGQRGGLVIGALAAAGADVAVSLHPFDRLGAVLVVLGLAVPALFVHQLARGIARAQVVSSLSAGALLVFAEVALSAYLQLRHEFAPRAPSGAGRAVGADIGGTVATAAIVAVTAALAVGCLVDMAVPAPRFDPDVPRGAFALLVSAVAGAASGYLVLRDQVEFAGGRAIFIGAALGALAGLLAVAAAFVQSTTPEPGGGPVTRVRPVLGALLPLAVLAPVAFLLCLAIRS